MGEQTILCGVLQTGSILCFDKMIELGVEPSYASKLIQYGWETITEALKHGGITNMMDRLTNPAKIKAFKISEELKQIMKPLFHKHMDDILSGDFSSTMMEDWKIEDKICYPGELKLQKPILKILIHPKNHISEQEYFDHGLLMAAMVKAGVELAYETMTDAGIKDASAYYESLHETPLIANTIARKKLFEMNEIISDTAEYGCYLVDHACRPLLGDFFKKVSKEIIEKKYSYSNDVDNQELIEVNEIIRAHPIEKNWKKIKGFYDQHENYLITQL